MKSYFGIFFSIALLLGFFGSVKLAPEKGKWDFHLDQEHNIRAITKSLFGNSKIYIQMSCHALEPINITVVWLLTQSLCWETYVNLGDGLVKKLQLMQFMREEKHNTSKTFSVKSNHTYPCSGRIFLEPHSNANNGEMKKFPGLSDQDISDQNMMNRKDTYFPIYNTTNAGVYLFTLSVTPSTPEYAGMNVSVHVEMKGPHGYLSAAEWPLLPFYAIMCILYVSLGLIWLIVSFLQWRDLLRIQFWIGGVIFMGMLEKAMFYAEYQNVNSIGDSILPGANFAAEVVSAGKRTLARMLVIVVSLGFGFIKPRLGSHMHKVIAVGTLYFALASLEAYFRVEKRKNESSNVWFASVPLAFLDSSIFLWIFRNLIQTTRTLRLRRNLVKLTLYNHFTNTLIFSVVASAIFMLYSIAEHKNSSCLTDWNELWIDDAYWHLLFSVILVVIMILWRPTNNNQRYAFSPLLDAPEDDDNDEEEIEHFVNSEAYGVKMRGIGMSQSSSPHPTIQDPLDDDLKWVEENVPPFLIDTTMPILDSDEDLMISAKFEMSKMQ